MVRKKQKGVVKDALAGGANAAPAAVRLDDVVAHVPVNSPLILLLEIEAKKPSNATSTPDLASWFSALCSASTRFDQLKLLQLFRASVRKLNGQEEGFAAFTEATWRLIFRLFATFSADLLPLQKNFGLILQDLAAISASSDATTNALRTVAREELRVAMDALFLATKPIQNDPEQLVQVISLLLTLLDFPFLLQVLLHDSEDGSPSSLLCRTIQFLADQLEILVAPIAEYQEAHKDHQYTPSGTDPSAEDGEQDAAVSASTNGVLLASERCSFALKSAILLASLKEALATQLRGNTVYIGRLFAHCTLILQTRVVNKDLMTQTGLAYCLLLRLLVHGELPPVESSPLPTVTELFNKFYSQGESNDTVTEGFGDFGRLAVRRGFINSLSDAELAIALGDLAPQKAQSPSNRSVLDFVFDSVHQSCGAQALNTRLYAFQVLEAFLRRAVGVLGKQSPSQSTNLPPLTPETVANLTSAVLLNWENPSKRVNQFMHLMFTHVVQFQVLSGVFDAWKEAVVVKLTHLPQHSRARYGALSIIVTQYGVAMLLAQNPGLLQSILHAVGIKDVSAAAAGLFTQILEELNTGKTDEVRAFWMDDVVAVLLSQDAKLRASVAMYALPLLLKKDPGCVPSLVDTLRQRSEQSKDVSLWAIIEVLKFARKKITPEKLLGLSMDEIQRGLENAAPEARGAAFEALCASLKTTNLPTREEVSLLQRYLVISAKEITASSRMNSLNSLKTVFFRVKEFQRINAKDVATNARVTEEAKRGQVQELQRAKEFQQWIELFVLTSVYPGSLVQRSIVGLEVLQLYLQVFGLPSDADNSLLMTPHAVTCLLNMLIGSWDVIRSLANSILDLYPADLPGYTTQQELETLWNWALTLCVSPRQRESDAGANFLQLLYRRSDSLASHNVAALPATLPNGRVISDARVRVVLKLTEIIRGRLESVNSARGESPLVHGLLLSLRSMVDGTDFESLSDRSEWQTSLAAVFDCVHRSMKLSLAVVGDATSGVGDESLSDTFDGVVGEVSAAGKKTEAIPLRVDCRGHLILDDVEQGSSANKEEDVVDAEQRAVVGSWLAARECGAIVDTIMRRVPLPLATSDATNFFSAELACQGGDMLLNSLFELKHKGAVAMAYEAFEGVCKSFLRHGEKNAAIGGLPSAWADKLLDRLERSEQQFILRRSSGFAYSFVAILRAEPRNTAAVILPRVMANLLRLASQDTDAIAGATHLVWRSRVHALNILKLISQDAVLADDVAVYVAPMLEHAIFGFECKSWVVRNSSMMLFAAATQRALGDKRIADGASPNKIPSAEVFSRFPTLDSFLYRALQKFIAQSSASGVAPPGLFPVLMFLSRLRPTDEDEDQVLRSRGSKPLADFVPLILQCAAQSVLPIRDMAARVLGTIVRLDKTKQILTQLASALPRGVSTPGSAVPSENAKPKTTNYVHGVLLQAQSLINKGLVAASSSQAKTAALDVVQYVASTFLNDHLWLGSKRVKSTSVRAVVWEIVNAVVGFQANHATTTLQLQLVKEELMASTLQRIDALAITSSDNRDPGEYKCNRAIVGTFFGLLQIQWPGEPPTARDAWVSRVEVLLQSPTLEVRKRAFKQLAGFLELVQSSSEIVSRIHAVLVKQLNVETHPTVKTRLLNQLLDIQDAQSSTSHFADGVNLYLHLLDSSANVDVVGPALKLLALSVRDGVKSEQVLEALQRNVASHSLESQPLGLRYSAAVAIERSCLLLAHKQQTDVATRVSVDAWMAAVKLLQDDDFHVRGVVRRAVHTALKSTISLDASVSETALLPEAIKYVVKTFSSSAYGFESIKSLVLSVVDAPSVLVEHSTGPKAQDAGELCNRIFEAEGNNFYAESDLLAQLLATSGLFELPAFLQLKVEVLNKLVQSLVLLNESRSREQWLGGITYYASVFPAFFSVLSVGVAALTALSASDCETVAPTLAQLKQQATDALPYVEQSHPLFRKAVEAISQLSRDTSIVNDLVFLSPAWSAIKN